ncbi:MAG: hypothetical protein EOM37_14890 [Proteobacteria bacterium]|jgi:hypothetical protein|nr:hypothetical protein [Pseudomonadota bacterium]
MCTNEITPTTTPLRRRRLKSAQDCRRFLADLVHRLDADQVDGMKASKLGYLVNILLSAVRTDELENRLAALEAAVQERQP